MVSRVLQRFNPEARFAVKRAFTCDGVRLSPGQPVPAIPPRRLRQLYERRLVTVAPPATPESTKSAPVAGARRAK